MTMDYSRYEWQESSPDVWTREVDEVEFFYTSLARTWRGCGRMFFHMTGHLSVQVPVPPGRTQSEEGKRLEDALRKAWISLRFHHPTVASQVKLHPDKGTYLKTYHVRPNGWLDETFKIISTGQTGTEWANADPPAPELPTLNVVVPPQDDQGLVKRDLVIRAPHDIMDGVGTLMLFNNLVGHAATAFEQGDAYAVPDLREPRVIENLSPPFRVAANIPPQPSPQVKDRMEKVMTVRRSIDAKDVEVVPSPFRAGATKPGVHKRIEITLSAEETSALATKCKEFGVTVTHVFHAAIALVLRDMMPKAELDRQVVYRGYLLRNERPNCAAPYNGYEHAASPLEVDLVVPGKGTAVTVEDEREDFLRVVRLMRDYYHKVRDDPLHYQLAPLLAGAATKPLPTDSEEAEVVPPIPPPTEQASATISSMGKIDHLITAKQGVIDVFHPWVTGEELRSSLGLFLGTFRGELSLSAAYNDAWHEEKDVVKFAERCLKVARMGFGL
ncbi:uncharacterized protein F5Z01DRAFT_752452 [Emericellopsis atlantica]|uniref:Uncharacterized protein n=1 Tax=Emericellopsis atlantica TaxID=2614577 RepID=A0A9P8CMB1_9HYPO|nr:uncharacterized protein F5Z01DRAFT_752452 [Emericellopsis atlantica]KAG9251922.1 hypothetical protein F5Z01DRAFT_752452 [Emericellopsis atlantica]